MCACACTAVRILCEYEIFAELGDSDCCIFSMNVRVRDKTFIMLLHFVFSSPCVYSSRVVSGLHVTQPICDSDNRLVATWAHAHDGNDHQAAGAEIT